MDGYSVGVGPQPKGKIACGFSCGTVLPQDMLGVTVCLEVAFMQL